MTDETRVLAEALCETQDRCDGTCPDVEGALAIHGKYAAEVLAAMSGYSLVPTATERRRRVVTVEPPWEACKVCGGDHWTADHERVVTPRTDHRDGPNGCPACKREAVEAYATRLREAVERDMPSEPNLRRRVLDLIKREKP